MQPTSYLAAQRLSSTKTLHQTSAGNDSFSVFDIFSRLCWLACSFGHNMNTRSKLLWSLSGLFFGLIIGIGATWIFLGQTSHAVLKHMSPGITLEHLQHARLLRNGEDKKVLDLLEGTFPSSVQWFTAFNYSDSGSLRTLWSIREYYEKNGLEIPETARPVLTSLAPKTP
ncbi:MAG TPA: hypothetical protein VIT21_09920 [Chthoniobacterales bacterium]